MDETGANAATLATARTWTTAEVARELATPERSVRRWVTSILGPRPRGAALRLTAADVATLTRVKQLLKEGLPLEAVKVRLQIVPGERPRPTTRPDALPDDLALRLIDRLEEMQERGTLEPVSRALDAIREILAVSSSAGPTV